MSARRQRAPVFFDTIASLGRLESAPEEVPTWYDPSDRPFPIAPPVVQRSTRVRAAVRRLFQALAEHDGRHGPACRVA